VSADGATISWTTDVPADSQVEYRPASSPTFVQTTVDAALVTTHAVALTGLSPGTAYVARAISKSGPGGTPVVSAEVVFTTLTASSTVPGALSTMEITTSGAKIGWSTGVPADSRVEYRPASSQTFVAAPVNPALVTTHLVTLSGLSPGTLYYVRARSVAAGGQVVFTGEGSFLTTTPAPPIPPDPSTFAPPVEAGVATTIADATLFLHTGSNPIQTGVAPNTIEPLRTAVLRGKVLARDGQALPGVKVTILGHPELGQTVSRADGRSRSTVS
jgi:hypothetical protein